MRSSVQISVVRLEWDHLIGPRLSGRPSRPPASILSGRPGLACDDESASDRRNVWITQPIVPILFKNLNILLSLSSGFTFDDGVDPLMLIRRDFLNSEWNRTRHDSPLYVLS